MMPHYGMPYLPYVAIAQEDCALLYDAVVITCEDAALLFKH